MRTRSAKAIAPDTDQPTPAVAGPNSLPRLPPEMIARIQALAEEGQSAREINKLRATFELVNKEWYGIVDYLTHIVVAKLSDLSKLTAKLRSSKLRALLGSKTKSVTIEGNYFGTAERKKLLNLLERVNGVESLDFANWTVAEALDREKPSGVAFTDLLATFTNLRHFTFGHARCNPSAIGW